LEPELEFEVGSKELEDLLMDDDPTPLKMGTLKIAYKEMNLGIDQDLRNFQLGISSSKPLNQPLLGLIKILRGFPQKFVNIKLVWKTMSNQLDKGLIG
jgi:hypothetical protein